MVDLSRDGAGIVYGIRRNRDDEPWWQRLGVRGLYWCCNTLLDLQIPNNVTHYRVFSRQAVNAVIQIRDHGRYLASLSAYVGFRAREFAYDPIQRRNTPRNKSLSESINLATEVIVSNSTKPLRLASRACILVAGVYAVQTIAWLPTDPSSGPALGPWTSILLVSTTMLVLAIVCEYLGRLYAESHARPLYYVQDELSSSVLESGASSLNVVEQSDVHLERAS